MTDIDDWTKDADGKPVNWNAPPFRNPGSGKLSLLLPGEKHLSYDVHMKRIREYHLIVKAGK